ncbi:hypothetical protein NXS19_002540 [Fusarium pseudograminearum]|nr:hypothetical protein NXS19_002540 [Fusarium pseudograminearum]
MSNATLFFPSSERDEEKKKAKRRSGAFPASWQPLMLAQANTYQGTSRVKFSTWERARAAFLPRIPPQC